MVEERVMTWRRVVVVVGAALVLLPTGSAQATITVANTNDDGQGSLRQAIAAAAPGEDIIVPAGTYTLTSDQLTITKSLTISGHAAGDTIIRAGAPFRVFHVNGSGINVTIGGVTVRDGLVSAPGGIADGGGILNESADLTLQDVVVSDNRVDASGSAGNPGGIADGGGIDNSGGTLKLIRSKVTSNVASAIGGSGRAGGIADGGGVASFGTFSFEGSTIRGNAADARGGQGPSNANQFGGIAEGGGFATVINSGPLSDVTASTIDGNVSDASAGPGAGAGISDGGGIFLVSNDPPVAITLVTISSNAVRVFGGGGIGDAGGLFGNANGAGELNLQSATLSTNAIQGPTTSGTGGNFFTGSGANTKIANTIISSGAGPAGSENCGLSGSSQGFNLDSRDQCGFHGPGDQVNTDPLLGPLAENGGPTPTMALSPTSPAVDKGSAFGLGADQRSVLRPIDFPAIANAAGGDGSDIGAFELQPDNAFQLGKLKRNRKKGTGKQLVLLSLPDAGSVTIKGKGLKTKTKKVTGAKKVKLPVIPKGKKKAQENATGSVKLKAKVTYQPTGNVAKTIKRKLKLLKH